MLQDQYRALMQYSIPKECHVDKPPAKNTQDWHCVKVDLLLHIHFLIQLSYVNNSSLYPLFLVWSAQLQKA